MTTFEGWPEEAVAIVQQAITRHGGPAAWDKLARLTLVPATLTGFLPRVSGVGKTWTLPRVVEADVQRRYARFVDYPRAGSMGVFDDGRVGIAEEGAPLELTEHRASFAGGHPLRAWSPRDALYFFGYALTYYHAMPWLLAETSFVSLRRSPTALTVRFPPHVHTHSPLQTVYFDDSGLIVRHDYVAEVVSRLARGAHFWLDHREVNGVPIAMRRRVVARMGRFALPITVLDAHFSAASCG